MSDTMTCEWCAEDIPVGVSRCPKCQGSVSPAGRRIEGTPLASGPRPAATKPKAPAGWYPHPSMADTRRYWDGQRWTDHIAPASPAASPAAPPAAPAAAAAPAPASAAPASRPDRDETAFAWTLAVLPIAWVVVALTAPKIAYSPFAWVGVIVLSIVLAGLDVRGVRARGVEIRGQDSLGVPFYLIERTKKTGSTAFIPIVWFAAVAGALLTWAVGPGVYDFSGNGMAADIRSQLHDQTGQKYTVTCPDANSVTKGDTVSCVATDPSGQVGRVTVSFDAKGSYRWQLLP